MKISKNRVVVVGVAVGVLALASSVALVASSAAGTAKPGDTEDLVPTRSLKESRAKRGDAASVVGKEKEVDLLDLIQVSKDAVAGEWGFQERSLITGNAKWGRLQVPCVPPEEYDLRLTATRKRGSDSLNVGLVVDGRQTMLAIDGDGGAKSWLFLHPQDIAINETIYDGKLLRYNKPMPVVCSVRKTGIQVTVGDKTIIDWKGNKGDLYLLPGYQVPNPKTLILASCDSTFSIGEMVLIPVSGGAQTLR
jgi:hypothetical protein